MRICEKQLKIEPELEETKDLGQINVVWVLNQILEQKKYISGKTELWINDVAGLVLCQCYVHICFSNFFEVGDIQYYLFWSLCYGHINIVGKLDEGHMATLCTLFCDSSVRTHLPQNIWKTNQKCLGE